MAVSVKFAVAVAVKVVLALPVKLTLRALGGWRTSDRKGTVAGQRRALVSPTKKGDEAFAGLTH